MRISVLKYNVLSWVYRLTILILILMPFHAFLTVWLSSLIGHYTALRLWKETVLLICIIGVIYLLLTDHKIRSQTLSRRLSWLILAFIALNLIWGALAYSQHDVSAKALGYGLISDLRFFIFFLVTWAVAIRTTRFEASWHKILLWPAIVVVVVGLLQIVLPHDVLRHFGYGPSTIPITETINSNSHYVRVVSTLRGANPLGAYLIIPISLLFVEIIRPKRNWRQAGLLLATTIVLFYSSSRSAWLGVAISLVVILSLSKLARRSQQIALGAMAMLLIVAFGLGLAYRHNVEFQNFIFHTQTNSSVKSTSDGNHISSIRSGLRDLEHHPLGQGPGTAGPASVYNNHPARISEDYYIQVGEETGWLGLILFTLINIGVGALLYVRRSNPLALCLFASLIGLSFTNLLLPAWTDDTLAYVWWGLAGIAMAIPLAKIRQDSTT